MFFDPLALPTLWFAWCAQYGRVAGFTSGCLLREQLLTHTALAQHWLGCPNPPAMPLPDHAMGACDHGPAHGETMPSADSKRR